MDLTLKLGRQAARRSFLQLQAQFNGFIDRYRQRRSQCVTVTVCGEADIGIGQAPVGSR